uniref:Uncharacterized protein n=1 Tax=Bursaphelenchus xylophilus TaxID=6326 RepID=A0A1I7RV29_BURXY
MLDLEELHNKIPKKFFVAGPAIGGRVNKNKNTFGYSNVKLLFEWNFYKGKSAKSSIPTSESPPQGREYRCFLNRSIFG